MMELKKELQKIAGKKLMVVFPHPDDESMMTGGLLRFAHNLGVETVVVTLTRGGAGKLFINPKGRSAVEIREVELNKATRCLSVDKLIVGNFTDSRLKEEAEKWSKWLNHVINDENPAMIVTYDHSGLTGHPDHIVLSGEVFRIAKKRRTDLYWVSLNSILEERFVPVEVRDNFQKPTHVLDIGKCWIDKWRAVKSHKSQRYAQIKVAMPLWFFLSKFHYEWYHKVDFKKSYVSAYMDFEI